MSGALRTELRIAEPIASSNRSDGCPRAEAGAVLTAYGGDVPIEDVEAGDLRAGDVVRVDDRQAHRVERVVRVGARVVLEMRPVGLEISEAVRVRLPVDRR